MGEYIKNYNPGNIMMDLPYNSHIHELPLLSFKDFRNSVNLSLVFNKKLKQIDDAASKNTFNIERGFKLNIQKKVYLDDNIEQLKYIDGNGKEIGLIDNDGVHYTFDDDSKRVLKETSSGYEVFNFDFSKEVFNANGNLTHVYDKYGDLYLSYTYNSSNQLISVTYNGKTINFSYSSNQLNKIEYEDTETTLLYETDFLTINHYSGTKYECINETNKYTVNALLGTSILSTKSCEYTNNQSVLTYYDDNEEIEKLTYDFLDSYSNGDGSHSYIQVTNKLNVKQVMQFKNRKLLYSFEFLDDELNENDYYEKTVTIYDINNKLNNGTFNGEFITYNGLKLNRLSNGTNAWEASRTNFSSYEGKYFVTGWIKSTYTNNATIQIIKDSDINPSISFNISIKALNRWNFFVFQFETSGEELTIYSTDSTIEMKDVRLVYKSFETTDETSDSNCVYNENIIINNNQRIPFKDVEFLYTKNGMRNTINNLYLSDIMKYKLAQLRNINNKLLYYNDGKNVINSVTNLEALYDGQYISINNLAFGSRFSRNGKEYYTNIRNSNMTTTPLIVSNHVGANTYSYQYLNEFCDPLISNKDGLTTNYTRDKGLITQENVGSLYNIITTYTTTLITVKDTLATGVKKLGIKYHIDPIWGTITKIEYSDGTSVEDTFDDDKTTIETKTFKKNNNQNIIEYGYDNKGRMTSLVNDSLNYQFVYSQGKLIKARKFGSNILEQEHTEVYDREYYPDKNTQVYSKEYLHDKYNRVILLEDELNNIYNDSSQLSSSIDLIQGIKKNYSYNFLGLLSSVTTSLQTNPSNNISLETYNYDAACRLKNKEYVYDVSNNKKVKDQITYFKNDSSTLIDKSIKNTIYSLNGTQVLKTTNTQDSYKRINSKKYELIDEQNNEYNKTITYTYTNNKVTNESDGQSNILYEYDDFDRIIKITKDSKEITYEYDIYGRLIRENNEFLDKTIVYSYNDIGNIISKKEYSYTTIENITITPSKTINYTYDTVQKDRLITFDTTTIPYNTLGCPTKYKGYDLTWNKGKLTGLSKGTIDTELESISYTYNAYGQRVSKSQYKTKGFNAPTQFPIGELTEYNKEYKYDNSGRLIKEVGTKVLYQGGTHNETIDYLYDCNTIIGMKYTYDTSVNTYYFRRNILGDVIEIYDINGNLKVKYNYDAYGNCTIASETTDTNLARVNPIRYRGYYYDVETGLFWLSSRYYSPELCRFISPDDIEYLDPESVNGLNLYCYCKNNPIMYKDNSGHYPEWATFSNLFEGTSTALQLMLNGAYIGGYFSVVNAVRPNNIGIGIWNKQRTAAINSFADDVKAFNKFGNIMAAITVAIQVGEGAFNDYNRGYSTDRIISNAVVNTAVYSLTTIGLAKLGGFVGSFIPIPIVGTAIGTAVGYLVGLGVNWLMELDVNGKSVIDHVRDFVYDSWKSLFD